MPLSEAQPSLPLFFLRGDRVSGERDNTNARETGNFSGGNPLGDGFLIKHVTKPHKPVSSSTVARWLKVLLGKAGVNTEIFKAHSMRSASTSAAAAAGVTTGGILKAADWSSEAVFQKFYHKPSAAGQFGLAVLSSNSCHPEETTNTR